MIILVGCVSNDPASSQEQSTYEPPQTVEIEPEAESPDPEPIDEPINDEIGDEGSDTDEVTNNGVGNEENDIDEASDNGVIDEENDTDEPIVTDEMPTITVRFYYHSSEIDPNHMLLPEAYLYNAEEMQDPFDWEEFAGHMYEHTGINVIGAWFEGSKLYVDLNEVELTYFNWGSTGSADRGIRLNKTLGSVPDISSFEVLVDGQRGAETSHFNFAYVGIVENNQFVRSEFFDSLD